MTYEYLWHVSQMRATLRYIPVKSISPILESGSFVVWKSFAAWEGFVSHFLNTQRLFASFCNCRSLLFCRNYNQLHWLQMPSPMGPASLLQKQQLGKLPCNSNVPCRRWIWESKLGCVTVSLCHAFATHHCTIAIYCTSLHNTEVPLSQFRVV